MIALYRLLRSRAARIAGVATAAVVTVVIVAARPTPLEAAAFHATCDGEDHRDDIGATLEKRAGFEVLADVSLSSKVEDKLHAIAHRYSKKTGKSFVVTSGTRDPDNQAELIYSKLTAGEDILKLYKDKSAVAELVRVYDQAREKKQTRASAVAAIAAAIRAQMKRGIFISAHLKAGAADVRSSTMSPTEKRTFAEIANDVGWDVMLESTPPHFHLQLQ
ncbi:MAG: hypothetical protein HOW73_16925 [Polyangiaceae bacterium]|nr:hypothetical protein [Polyangiaceae bacterium]